MLTKTRQNSAKEPRAIFFLAAVLILFGALCRLLPHPPNFAPITAIALFGALYLPRRLALVLPLSAMLLSDALIGFYGWPLMASVYGSFALSGLIGFWVRGWKNPATVVGGTMLCSGLFFLITNAAVWRFTPMYPSTLDGLAQSYAMALPFFRNTLLGDFFYVGLLVGTVEAVRAVVFRRLARSAS